jgi:hypothetical protein
MAANAPITRTAQYANGSSLTSSYTLNGSTAIQISAEAPASTTTQYECVFNYADLVAFSALAQSAGLTLKWNSSGSPVSPMILPANISADWDSSKYTINSTAYPNPFGTTNVTTLYVTNSTSSPIQFDITILLSD